MASTWRLATTFLLFLFVASASAKVIFSRRVYKEHGLSYQRSGRGTLQMAFSTR
jgi:hypothetical protein